MSLLDPWRQARAEIIASRPTYTPFYTPGDYAVTVGNPDTGMVDQVAPEVAPQVVQRQNEVMDDGRTDDMHPWFDPRTVAVEPRPDQKFTGKTADNPYMQIDYRFANPAQPGLLDEPNNPGYGMTYGTGQGPVGDYAQEDLTSYYEAAPGPVGGYGLPGAMTMANMTPSGVTYDESGRAYAPALDPRDEPPSLLESMGLVASKDTRGGEFDTLGQSLLDPEITDARNVRDTASFLARGLPMGTLFSHMMSTSRAGDLSKGGGPYGRDSFGNYRFNASGPMGTLMSPLGELITPENYAYGGPMMNDYTGRYGLGTVGNTGISATPAMFNDDGTPKGGAFGYGIGFKLDGTFGSLNAVDVNDQQGIDDQMGRAGFDGDETGAATGTTAMGDTYSASGMTGGIEDYFGDDGDGGGGGGDGCVIATHGVKTGGFSERDKAKAEVWCQKKYHGKWWGELFRKGYQYLGNRAIDRGKAEKYYGEFKAFIAYGRGLKPGLKHAINYYLRTVQFFTTGAALTGVEQFQKLRKKIYDLRNR